MQHPITKGPMRRNLKYSLAALALAVCSSVGPGAKAQDNPLIRHSADFFKFDGTEFFTTVTAVNGPNPTTPGNPDGALFYRKKVTVQRTSNILYVSIYTTGDSHDGAALWLSCRVNSAFCRPATPVAVDKSPSGWIALLKLPQDVQTPSGANNCNDGGGGSADCHDNAVTYQWCVPVRGGSAVLVDLKMATSKAGSSVFIEKGHVYIDSSGIRQPDRCVQAPPVVRAALAAPGVAGSTTQEEIAGSTTQEEKR